MRRMVAGCLLAFVVAASAATALPPPKNLAQRAGFDQRVGSPVPMNLAFREADGRVTHLATLAGGKPILLALGYYQCPNLCGVVLHGMAQAIRNMQLQPAQDYQVVFVSIDPHETPADASRSEAMLAQMNAGAHVDRWHLLTGEPSSIKALADAVGFRYFYDARNHQYAHAAGVVVLTPQGRVAQYLFGVSYPPRSVRLALVNASQGRLGNVIDQLVLLCCGYDPTTGRYSLLIGRVMQFLGIGFALLLMLGIGGLWLRRRTPA